MTSDLADEMGLAELPGHVISGCWNAGGALSVSISCLSILL